jgi:hypothetical protein
VSGGKQNWFPDLHQISHRDTRNSSWLLSAWLGVFYAVVYFPTMLWEWCLKPFCKGLAKAVIAVICFVIAGFQGNLHSDHDTLQEAFARGLEQQFGIKDSGED